MELHFLSRSENEVLARLSIAAFLMPMDPTMEDLNEIKTVVSEAVTNAVIHGYENKVDGIVILRAQITEQRIEIEVEDHGVGIDNLEEARHPLFTTKPEL